jgi:hypothetical protein
VGHESIASGFPTHSKWNYNCYVLLVTNRVITLERRGNGAKVTPLVRPATRFVSWRFAESPLVSLLQEVAVTQGER